MSRQSSLLSFDRYSSIRAISGDTGQIDFGAATTLWSKARVNAMHRYDCICEFKFPVKNASGFGKASKKRIFLFLVHASFSDLTF
jgi:hypothetical protein